MNRTAPHRELGFVMLCTGLALALAAPARAQLELVSVNRKGSGGGNDHSAAPALSRDGRFVAFVSRATDLTADTDLNGVHDVFLRDRLSGSTVLISVNAAGNATGDRRSGTDLVSNGIDPAISADGRLVVFTSLATDLVAGDDNQTSDVFARDPFTGQTELISVDLSGTGVGDGGSWAPVQVSDDGRFVAFLSQATNLAPGLPPQGGSPQLFVRDRLLGRTQRVSLVPDERGYPRPYCGGMSADGSRLMFSSVHPGTLIFDFFVRDLPSDQLFYLPALTDFNFGPRCWISADGHRAFFITENSLAANDRNLIEDLYAQVVGSGPPVPVMVDLGGQAQGHYGDADFAWSGEGRSIVFEAPDGFVSGDVNGLPDLIVRDLVAGTNSLVSIDTTGTAGAGGGARFRPDISRDGRWALWRSPADTLVAGDDNGEDDLFARDLIRSRTLRLTGPLGLPDTNAVHPRLSAQGETAVFGSGAALLPGTANSVINLFAAPVAEVFRDGFESGRLERWSDAADH